MSVQGVENLTEQPTGTEPDETQQKRIRTLTETAQETYQAKKLKLSSKLNESWEKVNKFISEHAELSETSASINSETVRQLQKELNSLYGTYRLSYGDYAGFLLRTGTADSNIEYEKILTLSDINRNLTDNFRE